VPGLLKRIVDEDVYKNDYEGLTEQLLEEKVAYTDAIKSVLDVISSGGFRLAP